MLILLIVSVILGGLVSAVTGIGLLFWVVAVVVFIFGLPGALITGFIHGENKYAQDRADYREMMRDLAEDQRALEHELAEDERTERYIGAIEQKKTKPDVYIDNRQIHIHNHRTPKYGKKLR